MSASVPRAARLLRRLGQFFSAAAVVCGLVVLAGWVMGEPVLTRLYAGSAPTAPSTALSFVLLGALSWARVRWPASVSSRRAAASGAWLTALVAAVLLAQEFLGLTPVLEERLFGFLGLSRPDRIGYMSPVTAACFVLLSAALLLLTARPASSRVAGEASAYAALAVIAVQSTVLLGFWYGTPLFQASESFPVALPTALAFAALGLGILAAAGPDTRLMRTLTGASTRSRLIRAFLPAIVLVDVLEGWAGSFIIRHTAANPAVVTAVATLGEIAVILVVIYWIASRVGGSLDQAQRSLRESEDRYRTLFNQSGDYALVLRVGDGVPVILDANEAALKAHGYSREEMVGQPVSLLEPEITPEAVAERTRLLAERKPMCMRHRRKDGSVLEVESISRWARIDGRDVVLTVERDIGERKRAEQERERLQAQLAQAQKMESIGRLAGGVAHDFNNLLTVINGYSALTLSRMQRGDPARPAIEEIHRAGDRASGLVRQLLAFSRKQVLRPEALDLNGVVGEMEKMLHRLVGEDVAVVTRLASSPAMVMADRHQIEQVIMNLAVNARDAMPEGGTLTIQTENLVQSGTRCPQVRLTVEDTGTGMDEETGRRLFEPFFTTKGVGMGTGLGLAMVHGIVAQSGGRIEVESEPGKGTTFHIWFSAVEATPEAREALGTAAPPGGSETILLVEDQQEVRRFTATVLESYGYRVLQASGGEQALERCATERADLLLTDVTMPGMSGLELAARAGSLQPTIRTLFMSGYSEEVHAREGRDLGGSKLLQKPFLPKALAQKVREALDSPRSG